MVLSKLSEFQWDKGNINKNLEKHGIGNEEIEKAFFGKGRRIFDDKSHSFNEERSILIGKTDNGKLLFIVFTVRDSKIRVVSARNTNRKEKYIYEKTT